MHEIGLVEETLRIVSQVAKDHNLTNISKVNVAIGVLLQVQSQLFAFAFDAAKSGTIFEHAELSIERLPTLVRCKQCGLESPLPDLPFLCPGCGASQLDIIQGRDIFIQSIEGE